MKMLIRLVFLLLSLVGIVACVVVIVAVWKFQERATDKLENVITQVDNVLERVSSAIPAAHRSLKEIKGDISPLLGLDEVNEETRKQIVKYFHTLTPRLTVFANAAVLSSSFQKNFEELSLIGVDETKIEKVKVAMEQASKLMNSLDKMQKTLERLKANASQEQLIEMAEKLEQIVEKCDTIVDEWEVDLKALRGDVQEVKSRGRSWIYLGAILITVITAWMGLGQFCMFLLSIQRSQVTPQAPAEQA